MEKIADLCMYLNPFSEDFFGYKLISGIIEGLSTFFVGDGTEENRGIFGFLQSIFEGIGNLVDFVLNFFSNLLEFFVHLFVPTDEQWEDIKQQYVDLGDLLKSKIPFVNEFTNSIENAQNQVFADNDFLNIKMPSFSFYGGETDEQQFINVRDAYEPYRVKIRSLLALIVYGCGFVYLLKTVLNYNATASGLDHAIIQSHLKGKGD